MNSPSHNLTLLPTQWVAERVFRVGFVVNALLVGFAWFVPAPDISAQVYLISRIVITAIFVVATTAGYFVVRSCRRREMGLLQLSEGGLSLKTYYFGWQHARWDQIKYFEIIRFWGMRMIRISRHERNSKGDLWVAAWPLRDLRIIDGYSLDTKDLLALLNDYRDEFLRKQPPAGAFSSVGSSEA